jgi:hypothetical protein
MVGRPGWGQQGGCWSVGHSGARADGWRQRWRQRRRHAWRFPLLATLLLLSLDQPDTFPCCALCCAICCLQDKGGDAAADETKFDAFLGNDAGVLGATGVYDEEDREADNVWDQIEDRMDERRKVRCGWGGLGARGLPKGLCAGRQAGRAGQSSRYSKCREQAGLGQEVFAQPDVHTPALPCPALALPLAPLSPLGCPAAGAARGQAEG